MVPWLLFFFACLSLRNAIPTYLQAACPTSNLYTPNSTYQRNLDHLLSSLYSNVAHGTGSYNASYGSSPGTVYGSFLCRGDVSAHVCLGCVETAAQEIRIHCPNQKQAITWHDECQLHYSNQPFFSVDHEDCPMFYFYNGENISLNPDQFRKVLNETMIKLLSQELYSLAQCTVDLSGSSCHSCLTDCVAYLPTCCGEKKGGRSLQASLNVSYELYSFYITPATAPTPAVPHPANRTSDEGKDGVSISTALAISVLGAFIMAVLFIALCYFLLRRKAKEENHVRNESLPVGSLRFEMGTIRAATDNFSDMNKIDDGEYGAIYKGILSNGEEVAVKRLSGDSEEIAAAFRNEALLIARLQHRNLRRLLGFCAGGGERTLIYELVSNNSLASFIFDQENRAQLDWPLRFRIIEGIARGLLYLHEDAPLSIIHCDLKASSILLDGRMNAKISNFGMARGLIDDQSLVLSHRVAGTYGHIAPECVMHGQFSAQSDVYSFGVLLLEIVSGRKNEYSNQPELTENLLSDAWRYWNEGQAMELSDPILSQCYPTAEVMKCIQIGLLCVQEDAAHRPTMASVLIMLSSDSSTLPLPCQLPPSVPCRAGPRRAAGELEASAMGLGISNAETVSVTETPV